MNKKYYWLKLKNDFFDREEIKIVEAMQNGKEYIIFYMKLLLKSIQSEGKLLFRDTMPYSLEMLATITGTNIDTVTISIKIFLELGLMEKWDDGTIYMIETQNMVGSETKWAEYKREARKNIGQCPKKSKEIPIELDRDIRYISISQRYIGQEYNDGQNIYKIDSLKDIDGINIEIFAINKSSGEKVKSVMKFEEFENAFEENQ